MNKWLGFLLTLVAAAIVGWVAASPPAPLPASAAASAFSAERAMADVRVIAARPHPAGSPANDAVRAHLVARLQVLGFQVRTADVPIPARARKRLTDWGTPNAATARATNIIAVRPGRDSATPAVALMAHYDSVSGSPGAPDDAAGVAAALEIARAIPVADQARDLVILLTDAEEIGLSGARSFFGESAAADPLAVRIGVLINMESRGGGGRAIMFETGPGNGNIIALMQARVARPNTNSLAVRIYELLPNSTDFTPARKRGVAGLNFAFSGDARLYHSPLATPDALDRGSLQHIGGQALDATRALLTMAALPAPAPDVVFSDVLGLFIIAYPPAWGWAFIAVAALGIGLIGWRRASKAGAIWGGMALVVVITLLAAGLLYGFNALSLLPGKPNYYDRLAALPRLEWQALAILLAVLALLLALPRPRLWSGWTGIATLNLGLATAVQVAMPAAGPLFAWPLLLAVAAMALVPMQAPAAAERFGGLGPWLAGAAAVVSLAFLGGFGHAVLLAVGPDVPSAVAVFVPMALLLLWPLLPVMPRRNALLLAGVLLVAAGGLSLSVRLDPMAETVPAYAEKG